MQKHYCLVPSQLKKLWFFWLSFGREVLKKNWEIFVFRHFVDVKANKLLDLFVRAVYGGPEDTHNLLRVEKKQRIPIALCKFFVEDVWKIKFIFW